MITAVEKDTRKSFTDKQYEQGFINLRDFIKQRNEKAFAFLKSQDYLCTTHVKKVDLEEQKIQVFPIPANHIINVVDQGKRDLSYFISNAVGSRIVKGRIHNSYINISSLNPGIYFLTITHLNKQIKVQKIIKSMP